MAKTALRDVKLTRVNQSRGDFLAKHVELLISFLLTVSLCACDARLSDPEILFSKSHRAIRGDETQSFDIRLEAETHIFIEAVQSGIDIGLTLESPTGKSVSVNTPLRRDGSEILYRDSIERGKYSLTIFTTEHPHATGTFSLQILALPDRGRGDRLRIQAAQQLTDGARDNLRAAGQQESGQAEVLRIEAAKRYRDSAAIWSRLEDERRAASALFCSARLEYDAYRWNEAASTAETAMQLIGENDDARLRAGVQHLHAQALMETESDENLERALGLLAEALQIYEALGDVYSEARTENTIGLAMFQQGKVLESRAYFLGAAGKLEAAGERYEATKTYNNIAKLDERRGELLLSLESYQKALRSANLAGDPQGRAIVLENYADTQAKLGNMEQALLSFHEAAELFGATGDRLGTARAFAGIGVVYYQLGSWRKAVEFLKRSLEQHGAESEVLPLAETYVALGNAYRNLGLSGAAIEHHSKVLDLIQRPAEQAAAHLELGRDYHRAGDESAALTHFDRAIEMAGDAHASSVHAYSLQERGALIARHDHHAGLANLNAALALHREAASDYGAAGTLAELAKVYQRRRRTGEALTYAEQALDEMDTLRRRAGNPRLRYDFAGMQRPTYELQIDLLMDLHAIEKPRNSSKDPEYASLALAVSERAHARTLSELLYATTSDGDSGSDKSLRARHQQLRQQLAQAEYGMHEESGSDLVSNEASGDVLAIMTELDVIEARIRSLYQFDALGEPAALTAAEIQDLLITTDDRKTMLLEYALGEFRSVLWAVTTDSVESWILPGREELESRARRVHDALSRPTNGDQNARAEQSIALTELGEALLGPVADRLDGHRLAIVPDGGLHFVPFGALRLLGESGYLVQRSELVMLPSASVLAALRSAAAARPIAPKFAAIIADPVFGPNDERIKTESLKRAPVSSSTSRTQNLPRLLYTAEEARAIREIVSDPQQMLSLTGAEATRLRVLSAPLSEYRIIHIGSHGLIDAEYPALSAIALAAYDEHGDRQPNLLRLDDIYNLKLNSDLVVLSACDTALGVEVRGEGLVGLTQAFMYAGTMGVIASLWAVEDRATSVLMRFLYDKLFNERMAPSRALRSTQIDLIADDRWNDPYFWAPFFYQGDWLGRGAEITDKLATVN